MSVQGCRLSVPRIVGPMPEEDQASEAVGAALRRVPLAAKETARTDEVGHNGDQKTDSCKQATPSHTETSIGFSPSTRSVQKAPFRSENFAQS